MAERAICYSEFMKVITKSAIGTKKFAREMAGNIVRLGASWTRPQRQGVRDAARGAVIIGLQGELGSGKTTFVQGFLGYFGIQRVTSPTFVIIKKYSYKNPKTKTQNSNKTKNPKSLRFDGQAKFQTLYLYHIDYYRIKNSRDLLELGLEEIINDPGNIVLIEWADKIRGILPLNTIWIEFGHKSEKERSIEIPNFQ